MSGETEKDESAFTTDTLKAYMGRETARLEEQIAALDRLTQTQFASQDKEVTKAAKAVDKRLKGMNEVRAQLGVQNTEHTLQMSKLVTRVELDAANQRIQELAEWRKGMEQRGLGSTAAWGVVIAVVTILIALVAIVANVVIST